MHLIVNSCKQHAEYKHACAATCQTSISITHQLIAFWCWSLWASFHWTISWLSALHQDYLHCTMAYRNTDARQSSFNHPGRNWHETHTMNHVDRPTFPAPNFWQSNDRNFSEKHEHVQDGVWHWHPSKCDSHYNNVGCLQHNNQDRMWRGVKDNFLAINVLLQVLNGTIWLHIAVGVGYSGPASGD